jgi:hypothetical protein
MKSAHDEEMVERRRALESELALRRIEQAQRVVEATVELRDLGSNIQQSRDEAGSRARMPAAGAKLTATIAALRALGGPKLDELATLADQAKGGGASPADIIRVTYASLTEIGEHLATEPSFTLAREAMTSTERARRGP